MAEASFLTKQKARIDALQRHQRPSDTANLTSIRDEIRNIQSRLDGNSLDPAEIQSLRMDLQNLRRRCTDELHVSDVRWMHRELSLCQEKLMRMAKEHKPKFTFRRYRAAMMLREQEPKENSALEETSQDVESTKQQPDHTQDHRRISGYDSANVRVSIDGSLFVNDIHQNQIVSPDALILDNISSCMIHLYVVYLFVQSPTLIALIGRVVMQVYICVRSNTPPFTVIRKSRPCTSRHVSMYSYRSLLYNKSACTTVAMSSPRCRTVQLGSSWKGVITCTLWSLTRRWKYTTFSGFMWTS